MWKNWVVKSCLLLGLILCSIFYGMLASRLRLPPFNLFMKGYIFAHAKVNAQDLESRYQELNPADVIDIDSALDVARLRAEMIDIIWGQDGFPSDKQVSHRKNITDSRYSGINSLREIDEIEVQLSHGLLAKMYFFQPAESNGRLIIYHQGHRGDFYNGLKTIDFFLNEGFNVLAVAMPLLGMNTTPVVSLVGIGKVKLVDHQQMSFLKPMNGISLRYFLEPVVIALNYLESSIHSESVYMVGVSGGGWTTTLLSSIDERIQKSFSVAGTYPIYLKGAELGHFEESHPLLYSKVNYLEMYIMSTSSGREHFQMYNKFDPCCFRGEEYNLFQPTVSEVSTEVGGGKFEVYVDESHAQHKISDDALRYMLGEL